MLTVFTGCSALPTDLHLHNCINSYATASHSARTQVYPVEFLSAAGQPSLTLQQILAAEIENIFLTGRYFSRYLEMVRLKKKIQVYLVCYSLIRRLQLGVGVCSTHLKRQV